MAITGTANATSARFEKTVNEALVEVGEKFGLYSRLAELGPATREEVADETGIGVVQIGHWLDEQAAAGYLDYDRSTGRFCVWCDIRRN
jgi:hypothetical protein